jgi:23S rRNA (pseudouridine1915-N3)-methyltransferase
MKIRFIVLGRTDENYLREGIAAYIARIKHYIQFEYIEIPSPKNIASLPVNLQQEKEKEIFEKHIRAGETVVLLDEHGKQLKSSEFAGFLNRKMVSGSKSLVFVVGGPFGFHPGLRKPGYELMSLSGMTFSHQMVRLIFAEQLYRAFTILKNESYHHE